MPYRTSPAVQARKDARRRQIIESAIAVFAARGYHATTVKDIVDAAGTSVGNFYFYFRNKEAVFETLYEEVHDLIDRFVDAVIESPEYDIVQKFCRAVAASLWFHERYRAIARILFIETAGLNAQFEKCRAAIFARSLEKKVALFELLHKKKLIRTPDVRIAAAAFEGSFFNIVITWLESEHPWKLIDAAWPLSCYNLQALGIAFTEKHARGAIAGFFRHADEAFTEFRNSADSAIRSESVIKEQA